MDDDERAKRAKGEKMKNNKGVTLTSLIIYVIGMTIVVATIATLTSFFYKSHQKRLSYESLFSLLFQEFYNSY